MPFYAEVKLKVPAEGQRVKVTGFNTEGGDSQNAEFVQDLNDLGAATKGDSLGKHMTNSNNLWLK
jgi:hypothetical protein